MIYPLCDRTVTLYRRQGETVLRRTLENCHFSYRQSRTAQTMGEREDTGFLLVVPGEADILPGDRILPGIGEDALWEDLIPACVPGLCQVAYVRPCYLDGTVCHVEAGR